MRAIIPYRPRPGQKALRQGMATRRFGALVCHRRWGKTVVAVNVNQQGALACKRDRPRFAYIAPTYRQGKQIAWDPGAGSLLEFAETAGIEVASGCRAGSCGTCQTALEGGEVDYQQRPDVDLEPGHCLLCITTPSGDLTLAA